MLLVVDRVPMDGQSTLARANRPLQSTGSIHPPPSQLTSSGEIIRKSFCRLYATGMSRSLPRNGSDRNSTYAYAVILTGVNPHLSSSRHRSSSADTSARICIRKLVTITHIPILEELEFFRALYFRLATLGLGQQVHQTILDGLGHALGVSADVNIRPLLQYKRRERSPVVPDQILDVHLACLISHIYGLNPCPLTAIGLAVLSGERHMHVEFTLEFGGVFRPFILVQEVLVALPASVEEVDRSPIVQRIRPRLFDSSSCEGDPFLNEASERRDALQRQTGSKRTRSKTHCSRTDHDNGDLGRSGQPERRPPHVNRHAVDV